VDLFPPTCFFVQITLRQNGAEIAFFPSKMPVFPEKRPKWGLFPKYEFQEKAEMAVA
jgi:hypothetical protein